MKILDQLRPFISCCQFFGLIPFYVETEARTNTFKKFSFSLRHPVTWWFALIFISQIFFIYFDTAVAWRVFYTDGVQRSNVPFVFVAFMLIEHIFFFALAGTARYAISKYSHIRKVLYIVQKVHNELVVEDFPSKNKPSVTRRVILAMALSLICVSHQTIL